MGKYMMSSKAFQEGTWVYYRDRMQHETGESYRVRASRASWNIFGSFLYPK